MKNIREALTFDDVLLEPRYSSVELRDVDIKTQISKNVYLDIPIVSAAMDTVTESVMAIALARAGGLGVIHRNCSIDEQAREVQKVKKEKLLVAGAVGPHDIDRAVILDKAGVCALFIDCATAHKKDVIESVQKIKKKVKADVVVGNIATADAARALISFADGIKVGVGPGSICTTRVVSGVGVPQLTAIMDVVSIASRAKIPVIADGGIKYSGDIVKALAAGANAVMLGSIFAGARETPGEIIMVNGVKYKNYRGMGSIGAMQKGNSSDRYFQNGAKKYVPEGVEGLMLYKGK
ncbi:IMP dehydrogenase, partial [Patescibacteria group bacterium]|nr:IMP dehydrogenase [Patescibacteria group bacterium]